MSAVSMLLHATPRGLGGELGVAAAEVVYERFGVFPRRQQPGGLDLVEGRRVGVAVGEHVISSGPTNSQRRIGSQDRALTGRVVPGRAEVHHRRILVQRLE